MTDNQNIKEEEKTEAIAEVLTGETNGENSQDDQGDQSLSESLDAEVSEVSSAEPDSEESLEGESSGDDKLLEDESEKGNWYILQCYTGHEYKVKTRIEQLIEGGSHDGMIYRVLVPEEETIEIKNNKRVEKITRIYPGYCFVKMIEDEEVFFEVRRLPGVAKFVGTKSSPTPVVEEEILKVLRKVGDKTKKIDVDFEIGETIKVIGGPFRGYSGPISEINIERGKLKAMISIFGRETPVELEFDQVEKTV